MRFSKPEFQPARCTGSRRTSPPRSPPPDNIDCLAARACRRQVRPACRRAASMSRARFESRGLGCRKSVHVASRLIHCAIPWPTQRAERRTARSSSRFSREPRPDAIHRHLRDFSSPKASRGREVFFNSAATAQDRSTGAMALRLIAATGASCRPGARRRVSNDGSPVRDSSKPRSIHGRVDVLTHQHRAAKPCPCLRRLRPGTRKTARPGHWTLTPVSGATFWGSALVQ